jgi:hypothetical protein
MAKALLELVFYGREEALSYPAREDGFEALTEALRRLSTGDTDINAYYPLEVSDEVSMLVSIKHIQTMRIVTIQAGGGSYVPGQVEGMEFYLAGRSSPISIDMDPAGPISDVLAAMAENEYTVGMPGCVMLSDRDGNPFLFVPNDVQFILMDRAYVS